jgi:hypothetical protein
LYARLVERYSTKLDDNNCKQLFEYLKGAQYPPHCVLLAANDIQLPVTFIIEKRLPLHDDRLADAWMRVWSEGCEEARWTALVLSR